MLDPKTFSQSSHPIFDTNKVESTNSNLDDEDGYSNELDTPDGSEDENPPKVTFPRFKVLENDEDVKFEVGLQFSNKKQILEAIKTFAIMSKKNLKVKKMTRIKSLQSVNQRVVPSTYGSTSPFKRLIGR